MTNGQTTAGTSTNTREAAAKLMQAIAAGDATAAAEALRGGADPDRPDPTGTLALHLAIERKDAALVRLLLDHNADTEKIARNETALIAAARKGDAAIAQMLLDAGAYAAGTNLSGATALHVAASRGRVDIAKLLLTAGAPVNATDASGDTPLLLAAGAGRAGAMDLLLENGADMHAKDGEALAASVRRDDIACLKVLMKHGADLENAGGPGISLLKITERVNCPLIAQFLAATQRRREADTAQLHRGLDKPLPVARPLRLRRQDSSHNLT